MIAERSVQIRDGAAAQDVAIVGMACVFPKAPDLASYWQNIVSGVCAIGDPPPTHDAARVLDVKSPANDRIYCNRGGYLGDLPRFDPLRHGVMPVSVDGAEPEHFMALRVAHEALRDAGVPDLPMPRERTGVIIGRGTFVNRGYLTLLQHGFILDQTIRLLGELHPEYSARDLDSIKQSLKATLPPFDSETSPGLAHSVLAGMIANKNDFRGPTFVIDAACASCLIALELAVRGLASGSYDAVLTGGVQISTSAMIHMLFTQLGALSRKPQLRPFDADADGTMLGEGLGMIVLKRLDDAVRDGHRIYAVIKGVGSSSDGKARGLLAPRMEGEALAMQRAYESAGISPASIGLIEAHGTGIELGDITEIQAMRQVFGSCQSETPRCGVGTVKSMIGHLIPAAGIAGVIKTALALHHKVLPPSLGCDTPSTKLGLNDTPFYINSQARPWLHGAPDAPRRAGVNAFGFGGINAHAILEEHEPAGNGEHQQLNRRLESELCIVAGQSRDGMQDAARRLREYLAQSPDVELIDVAATVNADLAGAPHRLAIVAESVDDLTRKLDYALKKLTDPKCEQIRERRGVYYFARPFSAEGKLAFLFPGEGSQYVNMLADLCMHLPVVRSQFDLLDRAFAGQSCDAPPSQRIFPPPLLTDEAQASAEARLQEMDIAVDAVTTADRALFNLLRRLGIRPDAILGHSSGEFMALEAAGALALDGDEEFIRHTRAGSQVIRSLNGGEDLQPAVLTAVGAVDRTQVVELIEQTGGKLDVAMDNCPNQVVVCGSAEDTEEVLSRLRGAGAICQSLQFARPYHTARFNAANSPLHEFFEQLRIVAPREELYSCMTASVMPDEPAQIRQLAVQQWAAPVRFRETVEAMYDAGVRMFVEVGPAANLTGFVSDTLKSKPHLAVPCNVRRRSGIAQLHHALAQLAAHGVAMELDYLYKHRRPRRLDLDCPAGATDGNARPRPEPPLSLELPALRLNDRARAIWKGLQARKSPGHDKTAPPPAPPTKRTSSMPDPSVSSSPVPASAGYLPDRLRESVPATTEVSHGTVENDAKARMLVEHFKTMGQFLEAQVRVFEAFAASSQVAPAGEAADVDFVSARSGIDEVLPPPVIPTAPAGGSFQAVAVALPADAPQPSAASDAPHGEPASSATDLSDRLLGLVSEKTGYPRDMLQPGQNLEADLGISSIKRVEILGALRRQVPALAGVEMDDLTRLATLGDIIDALAARVGTAGGSASGQVPAVAVLPAAPETASLSSDALAAALLTLVSEKTGYPQDMLQPGQNLEADLGISSIKRVEILGALRRQVPALAGVEMEELTRLATLGDIIDALAARVSGGNGSFASHTQGVPPDRSHVEAARPQAAPRAEPIVEIARDKSMALLGRIERFEPGRELVAVRHLDIDRDAFLADHTLGGPVSQYDRSLHGLCLVPFSISVELAAQAAAALLPGKLIAAIQHIEAGRWITLEAGNRSLTLHARRHDQQGKDGVAVELYVESSTPGEPPALALRARFVFAEVLETAPAAVALALTDEQAAGQDGGKLYPGDMFHGPSLRSVRELCRYGAEGVEGLLAAEPLAGGLPGWQKVTLLTDPVLLDGAGQLVGLWALRRLDRGFIIFPSRVEEIRFYAASAPSAAVQCRARTQLIGDDLIRSDIDLHDLPSRVRARIRGLVHKRIDMPRLFHKFRGSRKALLGRRWDLPGQDTPAGGPVLCCRMDRIPISFWATDEFLWREVLAHIALSANEREQWSRLRGAHARRTEWLLGRVAAKEAVRRLMQQTAGRDEWLADIELDEQGGCPVVVRIGSAPPNPAPVVSIAHADGEVVAVAVDGAEHDRIGIDVERVQTPSAELVAETLDPTELALAGPPDDPSFGEHVLRAWCAKEAAGKALGCGMPGGPGDLKLETYDRAAGTAKLVASPRLARHRPDLTGRRLRAWVAREGVTIVSWAIAETGVSNDK